MRRHLPDGPLAAKVLNLVPRHTAIVAAILGDAHARPLTLAIGLSEVALGVWILTGRRRRATAWLQITLVVTFSSIKKNEKHHLDNSNTNTFKLWEYRQQKSNSKLRRK